MKLSESQIENSVNGFKSAPITTFFIFLLFILGAASFPTNSILSLFFERVPKFTDYFFSAVVRFIFGGILLYYMKKYGFKVFRFCGFKRVVAILPAFIIAINNFPFITFFTGQATIDSQPYVILCFVLYCISIGFFEEIAFRGCILPLCIYLLKDKIRPTFYALILSSAVFGLSHILNILGGANIGTTVLQVGYSFLIGAMCSIVLLYTGNLLFPILIHAVYDVSGLLVSECGNGVYWNVLSITLTALIAVIGCLWFIYLFSKTDRTRAISILDEKYYQI